MSGRKELETVAAVRIGAKAEGTMEAVITPAVALAVVIMPAVTPAEVTAVTSAVVIILVVTLAAVMMPAVALAVVMMPAVASAVMMPAVTLAVVMMPAVTSAAVMMPAVTSAVVMRPVVTMAVVTTIQEAVEALLKEKGRVEVALATAGVAVRISVSTSGWCCYHTSLKKEASLLDCHLLVGKARKSSED
eukprot:TRINITY_DN1906_c0_g1_i2.p3 TRINITY_DN1906_c0_g1~~TRINITY_DN1906_c0_g1_i2.p3  ORF type:complete len:190 (+),score=46.92 TRINITY_DN1906_c0_g1_i2:1140-1709(+)